ncbi:uncharacterized protein LOC127723648 [Mytilus californianus]|uniref:uncharacterized protein LOC127723648 n=1 Tax=Mytilus californianus TaxID=6549 RepID=UPI0022473A83|nr:uncharacterized protein LOC127723648 [Mytilus californianus]
MVVQLVKDAGISVRKAALAYGIPRYTVQDKVNRRTEIAQRSGPKAVISTTEESRIVYNFSSSDKTQITVLACTSATAHYLPSMIVYPGIRFEYNPVEGFENVILGRSINGSLLGD